MSAIFLSLPLSAQTEDDAKKAAIEFLRGKKSVNGMKLTSVVVNKGVKHAKSSTTVDSASLPESNVYAFNVSGGGFALVCTGNGNTAVAGYSDTGKDLQGKMVKKVTASAHVLADVVSSLPSGTYVLKSPTKTIKLRN